MKVLLITGTRHEYSQSKQELVKYINSWQPSLIIHGGCRTGVDSQAEKLADKLGIETAVVAAKWFLNGEHNSSAGPIRNSTMASIAHALKQAGHAVECLALPDHTSVGTWDMVRKMMKIGVEPTVIKVKTKQ